VGIVGAVTGDGVAIVAVAADDGAADGLDVAFGLSGSFAREAAAGVEGALPRASGRASDGSLSWGLVAFGSAAAVSAASADVTVVVVGVAADGASVAGAGTSADATTAGAAAGAVIGSTVELAAPVVSLSCMILLRSLSTSSSRRVDVFFSAYP